MDCLASQSTAHDDVLLSCLVSPRLSHRLVVVASRGLISIVVCSCRRSRRRCLGPKRQQDASPSRYVTRPRLSTSFARIQFISLATAMPLYYISACAFLFVLLILIAS